VPVDLAGDEHPAGPQPRHPDRRPGRELFGLRFDVAKPKVAVAWDIFDGLRVRGSYSEGFRAPNLEQVNAPPPTAVCRPAAPTTIRCQPALRAGPHHHDRRSAHAPSGPVFPCSWPAIPDLKPEESTNQSYRPRVPAAASCRKSWGDFTLTVDRWSHPAGPTSSACWAPRLNAVDAGLCLKRVQDQVQPDCRDPRLHRTPMTSPCSPAPASRRSATMVSISDRFVNLLPQDRRRDLDIGFSWRQTPDGLLEASRSAATSMPRKLLTYSGASPATAGRLRSMPPANAGVIDAADRLCRNRQPPHRPERPTGMEDLHDLR
jgi:iron complex outermembrane receptor protein